MTDITLFRGPIRLMLDDWDPQIRRYPDAVLDDGVRAVVKMGLLNRSALATVPFSITVDGGNISPDVISASPKSPDLFALVCYQTTKLFLAPKPDRSSFRTRALSASTGSFNRYLMELDTEIARLENGDETYFTGYQSFFSWMEGGKGLPLGEILAQFNVQSPLWSAVFTRDGMRVA
jgi:hypothetical protein